MNEIKKYIGLASFNTGDDQKQCYDYMNNLGEEFMKITNIINRIQ